MPLPWVRLDTSMPDHPKVIDLADEGDAGKAALFVWICSLAYCGKHGTDGFVPRAVLPRINGTTKHARMLVDAGLWRDESGVGWMIHGWAEFQESNEETQARSERARSAALARWAKASKNGAPR